MNYIEHRFSLVVEKTVSQTAVKVKRGDTLNRLIINLTDHGYPYHISEEVRAFFVDGDVMNACTIDNCSIIYDLTTQTVGTVGRHQAEIRLVGHNDEVITTAKFTIIVENTIYDDNQTETVPRNDVDALTGLISEASKLIEELKNTTPGSGGVTEETDPTVHDWAKQPTKPTYTASEVGADYSGAASDKVAIHNADTDAHNDIRLLISGLTTRLDTLANSSDTDLDQLAELVAYIKANRTLIESITTSKVSVSDIVNNLTTNVANRALSAAQGVALKSLIDAIKVPTKISAFTNDKGYITQTEMKNYVNETILNGEW